jgi:hypothetical protein
LQLVKKHESTISNRKPKRANVNRDYCRFDCFNYAKFELELCPYIGLNNGSIGVATRRGADKNMPIGKPRFDFACNENILFKPCRSPDNSRWMKILRFIKKALRI